MAQFETITESGPNKKYVKSEELDESDWSKSKILSISSFVEAFCDVMHFLFGPD